MGKFHSSLIVLSALVCLTWGWQPGTQYVYKYSGRSATGIKDLKQQNAVIELKSRVIVQSQDQNTIVVQIADSRIKRNGNFLKSPYFSGEDSHPEEIEGEEERITNPEVLSAPFIITHNKGSINGVKIDANEPEWIVNLKKSIAGQLQLDLSGVRQDGPAVDISAPKDGQGASLTVFEDSISGDCSTHIAISTLPRSQVYSHSAHDLISFNLVCRGEPVYEIIKTKDFNRCQGKSVLASAIPSAHSCEWGAASCGDFMKRSSITKYIACGSSLSDLTVVQVSGFSDLLAAPFATKTEELINSVITNWSLEKKEEIRSRLSVSSSAKEHKSLSHVFEDLKQWNREESRGLPQLSEAMAKSRVSIPALHRAILETLAQVSRDLKERPDSEKDKIERLVNIARGLQLFSLDELKALWQDVKSQDEVTVTLLVDCLVQCGSNPTILLIKQLIESEQITGAKATWALASLGIYAKTPTRELLHELVNLLKSSPVQSNKAAIQSALSTVADLMNAVCGSRHLAAKRFPIAVTGDLCDSKDAVVIDEFLPLLVRELEQSQTTADRIVVLAAFGSLGVEEIVPILLPIIRGAPGKFDNTAERVRAILSLQRVVLVAPEKIQPILASLAANHGERPEIRMASLGMLLMSNAPLSLWQKFAISTWFERSRQVESLTQSLIDSLTKLPTTTPLLKELSQKAHVALPLVKPVPFGLPLSFVDIRSTQLEEEIAVMMQTPSLRVADQELPVFLANKYQYQLGPFTSNALEVYLWNYNMSDLWKNLIGKLYGSVNPRQSAARAGADSVRKLAGIWEELNPTPKPADKRAGLLHINLLGSVNRFIDLERIEEMIPRLMAQATLYKNTPLEVSVTKYRMLGEINVHLPTELGLPLRFLATLPMLVSLQGRVAVDGQQGGIKSDIAAELSWKLSTEMRVDIPSSGNYVASGVDVQVDSHLPQQLNLKIETPGKIKVTVIPGSKVTDILHYHVRPYTISRNCMDSLTPTLEDKALNLISVTDKPVQRQIQLGEQFGINVKLIEESEVAHSDKLSWMEWLSKWDVNGLSNLGFVPFDLRSRKYTLRYDPAGTRARSISASVQYQYVTLSSQNTLVVESGSSSMRKPSEPEMMSASPVASEFRPALVRVFKNIESGNAQLLRARLSAEQKDGKVISLDATMALSKDSLYTKDFTDVKIEKYTSTSSNARSAPQDVDYALCYSAIRNWNKPANYGFSKDVLYLTEEDHIAFGESCDHNKIRFKAKVYRDQEAAQVALKSPAGRQCQKDMASGMMYGSPACTEARRLDQTYNNYELSADAENLPASLSNWLNGARSWLNNQLYPFIVKHVQGQSNPANQATFIIKRDPVTGDSDMTFIRPMETVVAKNVRLSEEYVPFSPLALAYSKVLYPLNAGSNVIRNAANLTSGGVSESKCYVGPDAIYTFDGVQYNYTVDGCPHVLVTDCHKTSDIAIVAHNGREGHKIVTVVVDKDTIEMDASGTVTVNGAKTNIKSLSKESRVEIRQQDGKGIKAVVYPLSEGLKLEITSLSVVVKVLGSQIEISAPSSLRGRACGLCGDFNQEVTGEFKTPQRCAVSDGDLMAASFKLKSGGQGCSAANGEIERRLKKETETCESVDEQSHTFLPEYDLNAPTQCSRREKIVWQGASGQSRCESVQSQVVCQSGCKPHMMVSKPFTFKCQGGQKDFVAPVTVPSACISA